MSTNIDNIILTRRRYELDMFSRDRSESVWLKNSDGNMTASVAFMPAMCAYDALHDRIAISAKDLTIEYDDDDDDDLKDEIARLRKTKPLYLFITRSRDRDIHYVV